MKRSSVVLGVLVIVLVTAPRARGGEPAFVDHMERLGLADPGYAWHGYHDAIVCADWDGDGDVDILVVVSLHQKGPLGSQGRMYVNLLKETGKLAFEDRTEKLIPDGTQMKIIADSAPVFLDVDSDGDLDMSVVSDEHRPLTFINDKGVFRMAGWGFRGQSLSIFDADGDGDLDVLSTSTGDLDINEGGGTFRRTKSPDHLRGHMPRDKILLHLDEARYHRRREGGLLTPLEPGLWVQGGTVLREDGRGLSGRHEGDGSADRRGGALCGPYR